MWQHSEQHRPAVRCLHVPLLQPREQNQDTDDYLKPFFNYLSSFLLPQLLVCFMSLSHRQTLELSISFKMWESQVARVLSHSPEPHGHTWQCGISSNSCHTDSIKCYLKASWLFIVLFMDCKIPTPHQAQKMRNAVGVRLENVLPLNIFCEKRRKKNLLSDSITASLRRKGNSTPLYGWVRTGTGYPERFWNLPPWRSPKATWTWSWATGSGCPCLSWGLDQMASRSSFQP